MELSSYSNSATFWDSNLLLGRVHAQDRKALLKVFFEILLILPFAVAYKFFRFVCRIIGLAFSVGLLAATLGICEGIRKFFLRKVSLVASDFADWILYPLAVSTCLLKLLFAILIHPAVLT